MYSINYNVIDINRVTFKNEDLLLKKIKITENDNSKYVLKVRKKIKNLEYHLRNVKEFIKLYK